MTEVDKPYKDTDDGNNFGEHISEVIEFAFERCLFADLRCYRLVYMANCSDFASQDNYSFSAATDNGCTLRQKMIISQHTLRVRSKIYLQRRQYWSCLVSLPSNLGPRR